VGIQNFCGTMALSVRRNVMNVVRNYTDAEIKVREATSNDPWGPSSSLMSEIADMTYNVVQFTEIMTMIWKRINDHGKNWRHVYKALVLLDYLIKTGSERVATQCKENIFAIQTLKDFQFIDRDVKDQVSIVLFNVSCVLVRGRVKNSSNLDSSQNKRRTL